MSLQDVKDDGAAEMKVQASQELFDLIQRTVKS